METNYEQTLSELISHTVMVKGWSFCILGLTPQKSIYLFIFTIKPVCRDNISISEGKTGTTIDEITIFK